MTGGEAPAPRLAGYDPDLDVDVLRRRRDRLLTLLALAAVVAVSLTALYFALRSKPEDPNVLIAAAQRKVREAIGNREAIQFGAPVSVEAQRAEEYLVRGEAIAVNPSTLQARHYWYDAVVHRQPDGTWGPARLTLLPQ